MNFRAKAGQFAEILREDIPRVWDGKTSILEMRDAGSKNWRQMEWMGFYFEFLCQRLLGNQCQFPGPRYGKVRFDALCEIPWDFKAHAMNTSSHQIIVNDSEATARGIAEYGQVGLVIAVGAVHYNDAARTFQKWHQRLKGGKSAYEKKRIQRGAWSRLRKVSFTLQQVSFVRITDNTLIKCGSFQTDFRNSNGRPRRSKVLIDLERLDEERVHFIEF